jgi:hypothetical protein
MTDNTTTVPCPACGGTRLLTNLHHYPTRCRLCRGAGRIPDDPALTLSQSLRDTNARFWIWHNDGPVRLALRPGRAASFYYCGPTEEGYSYRHDSYRHAGAWIEWESDRGGRDCDGGHADRALQICYLAELDRGPSERTDPNVRYPNWREGGHAIEDEYAEAAGY